MKRRTWIIFLLSCLPLVTSCGKVEKAAETAKAVFKGSLPSPSRAGLNTGTVYVTAVSPAGRIFTSGVGSDGTFSLEVTERDQYVISFVRDSDNDGQFDTLEGECVFTDSGGSTLLVGAPLVTTDLGTVTLPTNGTILIQATLSLTSLDTDGDGISDFSDADADGNGTTDTDDQLAVVGKDDSIPQIFDADDDNDGMLDSVDSDDDGDAIADSSEPDSDGDGIPNSLDKQTLSFTFRIGPIYITIAGIVNIDSDRDGVVDADDGDDDGDGTADSSDTDDDGDHVLDTLEKDTDKDGTNDKVDTDDDGDGTTDQNDTDDDGNGTTDTSEDSDKDGVTDAVDSDDDGDGILDGAES